MPVSSPSTKAFAQAEVVTSCDKTSGGTSFGAEAASLLGPPSSKDGSFSIGFGFGFGFGGDRAFATAFAATASVSTLVPGISVLEGSLVVGFSGDKAFAVASAATAAVSTAEPGIALLGSSLGFDSGPVCRASDCRLCNSSSFCTGFCFPQNWHLQHKTRDAGEREAEAVKGIFGWE